MTDSKPNVFLLDLPLLKSSDQSRVISHVAASASPWSGSYNIYSSFEEDGFSKRAALSSRAIIGTLCNEVIAGPQARWDNKNNLLVSLQFGSFESISTLGVLNGNNIIALESVNGNYELVQFSQAELQDDGKWKLSKLLRAQFGTDPEMEAGSFTGANVIFLNEAILPLELNDSDIGLNQNWRVGPASDNNSAATYANLRHTNSVRSRMMLSPVHLKASKTLFGDYEFSWIRRGTLNADNWEDVEIPLEVQEEKYLIKILDADGVLKREVTTVNPQFNYQSELFNSDFGSDQSSFCLEVSQIGNSGSSGVSKKLNVYNT